MTTPSSKTTLASRVACSGNVLAQQVGDETVLLDLTGEQYFGLDAIGSRIWELMHGDAPDLATIATALGHEFDAEPAQIETDLLRLVDELAAAGLVEVH